MIVIVDYGLGNPRSILNMLNRVGAEAKISAEPSDLAAADKLVLPGVGAFDAGIRNLEERGLRRALIRQVMQEGTPILGICLGMHLMTRGSEEGLLPGLGWLDAEVARFSNDNGGAKLAVPHMGWCRLRLHRPDPLVADFDEAPRFYFAHSFHLRAAADCQVWASALHGAEFPCAMRLDHIVGLQFHPEKSHRYGMALLRAFAEEEG
ncbi:MAG: imidazole glycerol phosphate synthase subunit HisH [Planctomycetes bacterium]|nr:imidazole glycerol phosphate synthase subunit HisH [Planctomycetota bacterium]